MCILSFVLNRVLKWRGVVLHGVGIVGLLFVLNRVRVSDPHRHPYTQTWGPLKNTLVLWAPWINIIIIVIIIIIIIIIIITIINMGQVPSRALMALLCFMTIQQVSADFLLHTANVISLVPSRGIERDVQI